MCKQEGLSGYPADERDSITCESITPQNEEKFKKLRDGIFEVKTYRGIRILAFSGGSIYKHSLILVDGFRESLTKPQPVKGC
jgi:hypothetical protein